MYTGKSKHGFQVSWYSTFEQVPKGDIVVLCIYILLICGTGKALVIANEFFDALPVHQFVFTERGWCEKMVDIDEADEYALASRILIRTDVFV